MDLQWQRQAELWLRLMGAGTHPAALNISLVRGADTLYLEQCQGRAKISLSRLTSEADCHTMLYRLLTLLQPDAGAGIPLRAWHIGPTLWISAMAPPDSGAELWAELARRQHRLLDRVSSHHLKNQT